MNYTMIKRFYILLLAIVASVGMSYAQAGIVSSGTKGGMSYTFYDNGLLEIITGTEVLAPRLRTSALQKTVKYMVLTICGSHVILRPHN